MKKQAYKPPRIKTNDLRTLVTFFEYKPIKGPEPGEVEKQELHKCYAQLYNPSMKDLEILKAHDTTEGLTMKIRDTKGEYTPTNKHFVEIHDYRYKNKVWNILEVAYDLENNDFNKVTLGEAHEK